MTEVLAISTRSLVVVAATSLVLTIGLAVEPSAERSGHTGQFRLDIRGYVCTGDGYLTSDSANNERFRVSCASRLHGAVIEVTNAEGERFTARSDKKGRFHLRGVRVSGSDNDTISVSADAHAGFSFPGVGDIGVLSGPGRHTLYLVLPRSKCKAPPSGSPD